MKINGKRVRLGAADRETIKLPTEGKLKVTKKEAVLAHLETAIFLWFYDQSPIAIHTLTFAAMDVLRVLNKEKGGRPMLLESLADHIVPEYSPHIIQAIRDEANFLKHAGKDPEQVSHLTVANQPHHLLDSVLTYIRLGFPKSPVFGVFLAWTRISMPEFFLDRPKVTTQSEIDAVLKLGKRNFFEKTLPIAAKDIARKNLSR
jgi:hypothetical protein